MCKGIIGAHALGNGSKRHFEGPHDVCCELPMKDGGVIRDMLFV